MKEGASIHPRAASTHPLCRNNNCRVTRNPPSRTVTRLQPQSGPARFFEFGSERILNLSASVQSEAMSNPKLSNPKTRRRWRVRRGYGVWWHWNCSRPGLAHGSATTVLARSAPSTVAMLALRSHMVETAGARSSWSARAPPSLGWNPSTTKAGAQRRLGEHGGLTYDSSRLVLAGPAARQLALRSYKIGTRRGSSRARISRVVYDVAHDAG